jgi:hypothetical protein
MQDRPQAGPNAFPGAPGPAAAPQDWSLQEFLAITGRMNAIDCERHMRAGSGIQEPAKVVSPAERQQQDARRAECEMLKQKVMAILTPQGSNLAQTLS